MTDDFHRRTHLFTSSTRVPRLPFPYMRESGFWRSSAAPGEAAAHDPTRPGTRSHTRHPGLGGVRPRSSAIFSMSHSATCELEIHLYYNCAFRQAVRGLSFKGPFGSPRAPPPVGLRSPRSALCGVCLARRATPSRQPSSQDDASYIPVCSRATHAAYTRGSALESTRQSTRPTTAARSGLIRLVNGLGCTVLIRARA